MTYSYQVHQRMTNDMTGTMPDMRGALPGRGQPEVMTNMSSS